MEIKKSLPYYYLSAMVLFFAIGALLSACQKTSTSTVSGINKPVVEGYLVPGTKTLIKVYYQKYLDDTITYGFPITGLKLNISDGTNTVQLVETTPGNYTWSDTTFIQEKKTYSLNFTYQGSTISSKTTVPDKPTGFKASDTLQRVPFRGAGITSTTTFVPVTFSWTSPASWFYLMVYKNTSAVMYPTNANSNPYHDNETLIGQVAIFNTQPTLFAYTGMYKVQLFHINQEYNDAISAGGGTSLSLTNPSTNIVNGLGIFTSMQAATLMLDVQLQ
jgi:hypothetical protein